MKIKGEVMDSSDGFEHVTPLSEDVAENVEVDGDIVGSEDENTNEKEIINDEKDVIGDK